LFGKQALRLIEGKHWHSLPLLNFTIILTVPQCSKHSMQYSVIMSAVHFKSIEPRGNYNATLDNMKLVHWPLMGGLLHSVQRGGTWAG